MGPPHCYLCPDFLFIRWLGISSETGFLHLPRCPLGAGCSLLRSGSHFRPWLQLALNFPGRSISLKCACADNGRLIFFKVMMPTKNPESKRRKFTKPWCKQMVQERFSPRTMAIIRLPVFDNPSLGTPPSHSEEGKHRLFIKFLSVVRTPWSPPAGSERVSALSGHTDTRAHLINRSISSDRLSSV
jgi:hypothetical protein